MLRQRPEPVRLLSRVVGWIAAVMVVAAPLTVRGQQQQQPISNDQQMQILAVVNGSQITRDHLAKECMRRFGESVVEDMVNKFLINVECQKQGIQVTAADVENELNRRAQKFGMSIDRYVDLICKERELTPTKLRNKVIWTELALRRLAASMTTVSDDEIAKQVESEYGPKVQVRAIALSDPAMAQRIHAEAVANPDEFSRLAINHSVDSNSASVGGLLPPLRRNMGEPQLEQAAFGLQVGQVSEILQLQNQYIILKCERQHEENYPTGQDLVLAKQRIQDEIRESKLGDAAAALFTRMQDNAEIVNVINNESLRQQMPGVATTINGHAIKLQEIQEECLTRYGRDVLQSEINRTIIQQRLQQVGESVTDTDLEREIDRAAIEYGMVGQDGQANRQEWMALVTQKDSSKVEIYVQDEVWPTVAMKKIVAREVQVTEEDMQKGFEANFGPRVQALAIVCQDQRSAQNVWELAKKNPTEKFFGELAHEYSVEPATRAHYGEVPPIQMHGGRKVLEEEAFRLKPGEISGLIPVGQTWVVLWCKGRTTPVVQDFDAVKDELYKDILEKKMRIAMAEEFERLQTNSQIDNFMIGESQPGARAVQAARQHPEQQAPTGRR